MNLTLFGQSEPVHVWPVDQLLTEAVQSGRAPLWDSFFGFVTWLTTGGIMWLVVGLALIYYARKQFGPAQLWTQRVALGVMGAWLTSQIAVEYVIKPLVQRPRPFLVNPDWNYLDITSMASSFPSGHASWAFAMVPLLWAWRWKAGVVTLIAAAVISFSRIYVAAHWTSDVLAGACLGLIIGFVILGIASWRQNRKKPHVPRPVIHIQRR